MTEELWVDIPEYTGKYQASSLGHIRSVPHNAERSDLKPYPVPGTVLRPATTKQGYLAVVIRRRSRLVHQLVAAAFHGQRPLDHSDVNHINGVKSDNQPSNLEWATRSENTLHALRVLKVREGLAPRKLSPEFSEQLACRNAKVFTMLSPDGVQVSGENLKKFCAENLIPYEAVRKVFKGTNQSTSLTDWRVLSLETQEEEAA
jgi:hypothetical protein